MPELDNYPVFLSCLTILSIIVHEFYSFIKGRLSSSNFDYNIKSLRFLTFIFLFSIDLPISFIPIQMQNLYQVNCNSLIKQIILGIPTSMEFLFVSIFLFIGGLIINKCGIKSLITFAILTTLIGNLYLFMAPSAIALIFTRSILGMGYGLFMVATQSAIFNQNERTIQAKSYGHLYAGLYSGNLTAAFIGALVAEKSNYRQVYLIGSITSVFILIFFAFFLNHVRFHSTTNKILLSNNKIWIRFLSDIRLLALLIFNGIPISIVMIGYLNYFCPLFLNSIGISQTIIGIIIMTHGLSIVLFSPLLSSLVGRSKNITNWIWSSMLLCACAFLLFTIDNNIWVAVFSTLLLGLVCGFVFTAQNIYITELSTTHFLEKGASISIFQSISRIGQFLGPLIFGSLTFHHNHVRTAFIIGIYFIPSAIIFYLFSSNFIKHKKKTSETF